ncbi:unnamed protein product [Effrenium voratum]|nr:unnamed protein product [Effrenium voratum]
MAAFSDADSTIVLRHRPDECFRKCFHLESARRVFARWRYLILGQPISGDNGKEPTLSSWCIDKKPPDKPLKKACIDITKGTKCILPREKWASLPLELQPPVEQRQGGFEDSGEIGRLHEASEGLQDVSHWSGFVVDVIFSRVRQRAKGMEFQPGIFESNEGVKVYREKRPAKAPEEAASQPVSEKA